MLSKPSLSSVASLDTLLVILPHILYSRVPLALILDWLLLITEPHFPEGNLVHLVLVGLTLSLRAQHVTRPDILANPCLAPTE